MNFKTRNKVAKTCSLKSSPGVSCMRDITNVVDTPLIHGLNM